MLRIVDKLYGEFTVDGVLEELILSKPVQRLKGVYQGGASYVINEKWNVTRYEHSIGVMLLIKKFGGSIEEQIAGLLHDVSHVAFSHVIDYVYENQAENYHEKIYEQVITQSLVPTILKKYDYDYKEIVLDHQRWQLLEQSAPELCADRVDYTLRDMYQHGNISLREIQLFLENVIVINGRMYLKNIATARWFVKTYYQEVIDFFLHPLNVYGYSMLAKTLKLALDNKMITHQDLLETDKEVLKKLRKSGDERVQLLLQKMKRGIKVTEDRVHYDLYLKKKVRLIDPSVYENGRLIKASQLSKEIQRMNEVAKRKAEQGVYVRFVSRS